jgi:hypothetical protein
VGAARGPSDVIAGLASVALAVTVPFALLRLLPLLEYSTLHALDGVRQRVRRSLGSSGRMALSGVGSLAPVAIPEMEPIEIGEYPGGDGFADFSRPEEGSPPPPPVGPPRLRRGRAVVREDERGPVIGWHFDE